MPEVDIILSILGPNRPTFTGGTGGGELTPEMVRGALGMVRDADAASLLYAKVCGEVNLSEMERRLYPRWLARVAADDRDWQTPGAQPVPAVMVKMLRMVLLEYLVPSRCPRCSGRKTTYHRASKTDVPCYRCHGRGELPLKESERAQYAGIPMPAWHSRWSLHYRRLHAWLDELYASAAADLYRALR